MLKTRKRVPSPREERNTSLARIEQSKKGVKGSQFLKYQRDSRLSDDEWSEILNLTVRTLYRYRTENKIFDRLSSERILEVMSIIEKGRQVFGNKEKFDLWLRIPSIALGSKSPLEFFDTSAGLQFIKDELGRIEYGIFA